MAPLSIFDPLPSVVTARFPGDDYAHLQKPIAFLEKNSGVERAELISPYEETVLDTVFPST